MKRGYGVERLLGTNDEHGRTRRKPESWARGLRTVNPRVIDERAFMNSIRNSSLASPKLARVRP